MPTSRQVKEPSIFVVDNIKNVFSPLDTPLLMDQIRQSGYIPLYTQAQFENNAILLDNRLTPEEKQAELSRLARIANPDRYKITESQRLANIFNRRPRMGGLLDQRPPSAEDSLRQLVGIMSDLPGAMESALAKRYDAISSRAMNMSKRPGTEKLTTEDIENVAYGEDLKWLKSFFTGNQPNVLLPGIAASAGVNTDILDRLDTLQKSFASINNTEQVLDRSAMHKLVTTVNETYAGIKTTVANVLAAMQASRKELDELKELARFWMKATPEQKQRASDSPPELARAVLKQGEKKKKSKDSSDEEATVNAGGGPGYPPGGPGGSAIATSASQAVPDPIAGREGPSKIARLSGMIKKVFQGAERIESAMPQTRQGPSADAEGDVIIDIGGNHPDDDDPSSGAASVVSNETKENLFIAILATAGEVFNRMYRNGDSLEEHLQVVAVADAETAEIQEQLNTGQPFRQDTSVQFFKFNENGSAYEFVVEDPTQQVGQQTADPMLDLSKFMQRASDLAENLRKKIPSAQVTGEMFSKLGIALSNYSSAAAPYARGAASYAREAASAAAPYVRGAASAAVPYARGAASAAASAAAPIVGGGFSALKIGIPKVAGGTVQVVSGGLKLIWNDTTKEWIQAKGSAIGRSAVAAGGVVGKKVAKGYESVVAKGSQYLSEKKEKSYDMQRRKRYGKLYMRPALSVAEMQRMQQPVHEAGPSAPNRATRQASEEEENVAYYGQLRVAKKPRPDPDMESEASDVSHTKELLQEELDFYSDDEYDDEQQFDVGFDDGEPPSVLNSNAFQQKLVELEDTIDFVYEQAKKNKFVTDLTISDDELRVYHKLLLTEMKIEKDTARYANLGLRVAGLTKVVLLQHRSQIENNLQATANRYGVSAGQAQGIIQNSLAVIDAALKQIDKDGKMLLFTMLKSQQKLRNISVAIGAELPENSITYAAAQKSLVYNTVDHVIAGYVSQYGADKTHPSLKRNDGRYTTII